MAILKVWTRLRRWAQGNKSFIAIQLVFLAVAWLTTFLRKPYGLLDSSGFIRNPPRETVLAENSYQLMCVGFSRATAFFNFPLIGLTFLSKCKALTARLSATYLSLYCNFLNSHYLHATAGCFVLVYAVIHTFFHILRWADQDNLEHLLLHTNVGRTGLTALICAVPIVVPMTHLRQYMSYELRKLLHSLFYVFGLAVAFHVKPFFAGAWHGDYGGSFILNPFSPGYHGLCTLLVGLPLLVYIVDSFYVWFWMTERIETTTFQVLKNGVQMTMAVSQRFRDRGEHGGFAYVCLPWISKHQWHAFSLYEDPFDDRRRQVFMLKGGDWTTAVHSALQQSTHRSVWVQGPFPSPFDLSMHFDNQILVASGIGITPALSVIKAHRSRRRVNLVWLVRDPALVEFYLSRFELCSNAFNLIFYTGKDPLSSFFEKEVLAKTNVQIIHSRPDLPQVILQIIHSIDQDGMQTTASGVDQSTSDLQSIVNHLEQDDSGTAQDKVDSIREFIRQKGMNPDALARGEGMEEEEAEEAKSTEASTEAEQYLTRLRSATVSKQNAIRRRSTVSMQPLGSVQEASTLNPLVAAPATSNIEMQAVANTVPQGIQIDPGRLGHVKSTEFGQDVGQAVAYKQYVLGMSQKVKQNWSVLYCGGSAALEEALASLADECQISFSSESFAW